MTKPKFQLTEGEWSIMKAIWELEPCAAPSVQEALAATRNWSYSTVRTMMDRMVAKGILKAEKIRNLTLYRSLVTAGQAQRGEALYALKHAFDGALTPMIQCLLGSSPVNPAELDKLEKLIREKRKDAQ